MVPVPMILIVASLQDPAGVNIARNLIEHFPFEKDQNGHVHAHNGARLIHIQDRTIHADAIEQAYPSVDAVFFITRHASKEGVPTLTTHTPGNFRTADYGGTLGYVCPSNPRAQKLALMAMEWGREEEGLIYEVSLEATHHGPATAVPTTFFEIGSHHDQWIDPRAGYVVASAVHEALSYADAPHPCALGIGGGHYPLKLTDIALHTPWAVGHVIPKYAFPVDDRTLDHVIAQNGPTDAVILDWKGTPGRAEMKERLETRGIKLYKTKDF